MIQPSNSELHGQFLADYERYVATTLNPLQFGLREYLSEWRQPAAWAQQRDFESQPTPSPIYRTKVRVKRPESVVDKIFRKPDLYPQGLQAASMRRMNDVVGARIIVYFLSYLAIIDAKLRNDDRIEISSSPIPVAYLPQDSYESLGLKGFDRFDKTSGYNSLHYIARFRDQSFGEQKCPWFEIQVRTIAEDVWGEIEHVLGYKPDKKTSMSVKNQFKVISKQLSAIDHHFDFLFNELTRNQREGNFKDSDLLNAENLPAVLNEVGLGCAQSEIDSLLKLLNSRDVDTVQKLRQVATDQNLRLIRRVYHEEEHKQPIDFVVIASLAAITHASSEEEKGQLVKLQIRFVNAWEALKLNGR